jgi:hypothetical protein
MKTYELTPAEMIGRRLGAVRASKYRTQSALAAKLGVTVSMVNKVIYLEREPYWMRAAIAWLCDSPHEWFWGAPLAAPGQADAALLKEKIGIVYCARHAADKPWRLAKAWGLADTQCAHCDGLAGCGMADGDAN